jgi:hypothetical protein
MLSACGNKQPANIGTEVVAEQDYFADSLYKYHNYTGRLDIETIDTKNLIATDSTFKLIYANSIIVMDTVTLSAVYPFYGCYFVSKQKKFSNHQPIIVRIEADDYFAVILMVFDDNKSLISWKELSGGLCAGPSEYEDRIEYCPESYSIANNNTDLTFISSTEIIPVIDSVVIQDSTLIDSLTYHISINNNGIINRQLIDSVRFIKPYTTHEN